MPLIESLKISEERVDLEILGNIGRNLPIPNPCPPGLLLPSLAPSPPSCSGRLQLLTTAPSSAPPSSSPSSPPAIEVLPRAESRPVEEDTIEEVSSLGEVVEDTIEEVFSLMGVNRGGWTQQRKTLTVKVLDLNYVEITS